MPVVARHEKHRMFLPLKIFLVFAFASPDRRQAAAGANVNDLIQGELYRRQRFTRRYFSDARRADAFLTPQLDERRLAASFLPPLQLDGPEIGYKIALVDRNTFCLHPPVVGKLLTPHGDYGFLVGCIGHNSSSLMRSLFYLLIFLLLY